MSESDNESVYTEDNFVEHGEEDNGSVDGDFTPSASTQAISASETSSAEDSECESSDDASTDCVQQQICSSQQQSIYTCELGIDSRVIAHESDTDMLPREDAQNAC